MALKHPNRWITTPSTQGALMLHVGIYMSTEQFGPLVVLRWFGFPFNQPEKATQVEPNLLPGWNHGRQPAARSAEIGRNPTQTPI